MDVVGSEIGQKMRSAIKAKLTELGCYVDDELPDYVMVMVANKRTRAQMEDDLQLFLGDNTELFVNWLHQVLKKLQEVTITPLTSEKNDTKTAEPEKSKEKPKEKKAKEKKDKEKSKSKKAETLKKAKKKDKDKEKIRKKEEKKSHKSKKEKKSKRHEILRPNIPPLLMNIEKESEPSITDVFAGQILKNHGITMDMMKDEKLIDIKPVVKEPKRPILPIIDPATISSQLEPELTISNQVSQEKPPVNTAAPREEQLKEIDEIEAKIEGLKQKLAEQLDSMSEDEDFLNIRTEAEELMNDFAEDVFQEISAQAPQTTDPPVPVERSPTPPLPNTPRSAEPEEPIKIAEPPKEPEKEPELPQIELKLPKRPMRDRLGSKEAKRVKEDASTTKVPEVSTKKDESVTVTDKERTDSPERFTPEREPDFWGKHRPSTARSRLGDPAEAPKRRSKSESDDSEKSEASAKKAVLSSISRRRGACASVVRVRPRPRRAPASSLLLRAVADAQRSLLSIPPKVNTEVKRALVLPMRRCVDAQKIVIQVPADRQTDRQSDDIRLDLDSDEEKMLKMDLDKDEYIPTSLSKKICNTDYVPSRRPDRTASRRDDTLIVETINIHNTTVDKDKSTQFIVTMDGFNPNAFLAKKLKTEGLLDDEEEIKTLKPKESKSVLKTAKSVLKTPIVAKLDEPKPQEKIKTPEKVAKIPETTEKTPEKETTTAAADKPTESDKKVAESPDVPSQKKRLSDTSDDSDTQVIIKQNLDLESAEKRKNTEVIEEPPVTKKRKASPIVFNLGQKERDGDKKKEGERTRERTESASSDNHVIVTTNINSHKYDSLPSLPAAEARGAWCRRFPLCRYGAACAFQHPRCKFAAACTRRACAYSHAHTAPAPHPAPPPTVASHVVPAANYKSISGSIPSICKYFPSCANPSCHYYHPKPCRYGKACANKLECNFYHIDAPGKYRYPV